MKTIPTFGLFAALFLAAGAVSAASLSIGSVSAGPDQRVQANVVYRADGAAVTMLQFELEYDSSLFAVSGSIGPAASSAGKTLTVNQSRFMLIGFNQDAIGDGTVAVLGIAVKEGASPGSYAIRVKNLAAVDKEGKAVTISAAEASVTVRPAGAAGPQITADGVRNSATGKPEIASGAWVSVYGSNFTTVTRVWGGTDFQGTRLPTDLDGVKVYINGKPGYVSFISPGQINVLAPADDQLGPVPVQVVGPGGASQTVFVEKKRFSPGWFMFDPQGRKYIAAVHPDGSFVGKADLYPTLPMRTVKPGDIVLLFGTGFGLTNPPVSDGELFSGAAALSAPVSVKVGGVPASVWAGQSGAGLYQFNVTIPPLPAGDQEVAVEIGGQSTQGGAYLTVTGN